MSTTAAASNIIVAMVPKDGVPWAWDHVEQYIKSALDYTSGRFDISDVRHMCITGEADLWLVVQGKEIVAGCVTQLSRYPRRVFCNVIFLGGRNMSSWLGDLFASVKRFAQEAECDGIEVFGRPGWVKALKRYGFKSDVSCVELMLNG